MSGSVAVDNVGVEVPTSEQGSRSEEEEDAEPTECDRSVVDQTAS